MDTINRAYEIDMANDCWKESNLSLSTSWYQSKKPSGNTGIKKIYLPAYLYTYSSHTIQPYKEGNPVIYGNTQT